MKRAISLLLIFSACISSLCGCKEAAPKAEVGAQILGNFSATAVDGNIIDESVLSGHKLTMINIWATYCSPCIQELPDLGELDNAWGEDFQVVGIVLDAADQNINISPEVKAEAGKIISETKANYLHLLPSASLKKLLAGVTAVPTTYFVDENGNQIGEVYIGSKTKSQWKKIISDLLETM